MTNNRKSFEGSDRSQETSTPKISGVDDHERISRERIDALNDLNTRADKTRKIFDKVHKFIEENKDKLEKQHFFQRFQENLKGDSERFETVQREVLNAENAGKSAGGGLSIGLLKQKTSELEALGNSLEARLELLREVRKAQRPLVAAQTYYEKNRDVLMALVNHQCVKGFLASFFLTKNASEQARRTLKNHGIDPDRMSEQAQHLEENIRKLREKDSKVRQYLETPEIRQYLNAWAQSRIKGALGATKKQLKKTILYYEEHKKKLLALVNHQCVKSFLASFFLTKNDSEQARRTLKNHGVDPNEMSKQAKHLEESTKNLSKKDGEVRQYLEAWTQSQLKDVKNDKEEGLSSEISELKIPVINISEPEIPVIKFSEPQIPVINISEAEISVIKVSETEDIPIIEISSAADKTLPMKIEATKQVIEHSSQASDLLPNKEALFKKFESIKSDGEPSKRLEKVIDATDEIFQKIQDYFISNDKEEIEILETMKLEGSSYFNNFNTSFTDMSDAFRNAKLYQGDSKGTPEKLSQASKDLIEKSKNLYNSFEDLKACIETKKLIQTTQANIKTIDDFVRNNNEAILETYSKFESLDEFRTAREKPDEFRTARGNARSALGQAELDLLNEEAAEQLSQAADKLDNYNTALSEKFGEIKPYVEATKPHIELRKAKEEIQETMPDTYKLLHNIDTYSKKFRFAIEEVKGSKYYQNFENLCDGLRNTVNEAESKLNGQGPIEKLPQVLQDLTDKLTKLPGIFKELRNLIDKQLKVMQMVTFSTDDGKEVEAYHWSAGPEIRSYEVDKSAENGPLQREWRWIVGKNLEGKFIILEFPDPSYDCHSFTFTNGRGGWIYGDQVEKILKANGFKCKYDSSNFDSSLYSKLKEKFEENSGKKKDNYVVIYRNRVGEIVHSGILHNIVAEEGRIEVTSKSGEGALGLHEIRDVASDYHSGENEVTWEIWYTDRKGGRLLNEKSDMEDKTLVVNTVPLDNNETAVVDTPHLDLDSLKKEK